jgi:hypothetical protein
LINPEVIVLGSDLNLSPHVHVSIITLQRFVVNAFFEMQREDSEGEDEVVDGGFETDTSYAEQSVRSMCRISSPGSFDWLSACSALQDREILRIAK